MPANEAGLFLVEQINANTRNAYPSPLWQRARQNVAFPDYLNENFNRRLERHAPEPEALTELLTQLQAFLGTAGYYWLCACAVYPELHWQVTLYLGDHLVSKGQKLFTEGKLDDGDTPKNLAKLARLPWFRYGYMPDWLRERLVEALASQQQDEVHAALEQLLATIGLDKTSADFKVKIASEQPKRTQRSPLKEQVFLTFMADKLVVQVPNRLRQLLVSSVKLPIITKHTLWKLAVVILLITTLGFAVLEVKYYVEEQQRLAELEAEKERLAKETNC